jgi:branched-chain amino acid transport system permease protein
MLKQLLGRRITLLALIGASVVLLILPPFASSYVVELLTQMLIWAIVAMSLDILMGYTGMPSFGHATYMGLSAYSTAILITRYHGSFAGAMVFGVLFAAFAAALFGLLALRAKGHYFLLITMALGMVVWGLANRWVSFTNGDNGIVDIIRPTLGSSLSLKDSLNFYYFTLFFFIIILGLMVRIIQSPFGQTLVGIRESESRMRVLGYNVWLHKYLIFIITGAISGFSGVLWAFYNGFVSPMDVDVFFSLEALLMVAFGGPGTLFGAILGAGVIVFIKNFVSVYVHRWMMIMGLLFILTVFYTPEGIYGYLKRVLGKYQEE